MGKETEQHIAATIAKVEVSKEEKSKEPGISKDLLLPQDRRLDLMAESGEPGQTVTSVYYDAGNNQFVWASNQDKSTLGDALHITQSFMQNVAITTQNLSAKTDPKDIKILKDTITRSIVYTTSELKKLDRIGRSYEANLTRNLYKIANSIIASRLNVNPEIDTGDPAQGEVRRIAFTTDAVMALEQRRHRYVSGIMDEHAELKIIWDLIKSGKLQQNHFFGVSKKPCPDCTAWIKAINEHMDVDIIFRAPTNNRVAFKGIVRPSFIEDNAFDDVKPNMPGYNFVQKFMNKKNAISASYKQQTTRLDRNIIKKPGELLRDKSNSPSKKKEQQLYILDENFCPELKKERISNKVSIAVTTGTGGAVPPKEEVKEKVTPPIIITGASKEEVSATSAVAGTLTPKETVVEEGASMIEFKNDGPLSTHSHLAPTEFTIYRQSVHSLPDGRFAFIDQNSNRLVFADPVNFPILQDSGGRSIYHPHLPHPTPTEFTIYGQLVYSLRNGRFAFIDQNSNRLVFADPVNFPILQNSGGEPIYHPHLTPTEFAIGGQAVHSLPDGRFAFIDQNSNRLVFANPVNFPILQNSGGGPIYHPHLTPTEFTIGGQAVHSLPDGNLIFFEQGTNRLVFADPIRFPMLQNSGGGPIYHPHLTPTEFTIDRQAVHSLPDGNLIFFEQGTNRLVFADPIRFPMLQTRVGDQVPHLYSIALTQGVPQATTREESVIVTGSGNEQTTIPSAVSSAFRQPDTTLTQLPKSMYWKEKMQKEMRKGDSKDQSPS